MPTHLLPPFTSGLWYIPALFIGAMIGSFLNVAIYRIPLGMSVNEPKRSFCPICKKPIPIWLNFPLISWLWLRGKCRECQTKIPFRYFGVELLTALLFGAVWWIFAPHSVAVVPFLWALIAILIVVTFIDIDHLIIPTNLTWAGAACGLIACFLWPSISDLAGDEWDSVDAVRKGIAGWALGFFGLWIVVELGKLAFGKKAMKFDQPVSWHLKEPVGDDDPMLFIIDGEEIPWWDIFGRKSDQLFVEAPEIRVSGELAGSGKLIIREQEVQLPDGTVHRLENIKSLDGTATSTVIPREAMGMGDVHLLGMIGAFFGWAAVFFTLFAASIYAIIAALLGRVGFGKHLPFGPFLALGAVTWLFGAWKIWAWYLSLLQPFGPR